MVRQDFSLEFFGQGKTSKATATVPSLYCNITAVNRFRYLCVYKHN